MQDSTVILQASSHKYAFIGPSALRAMPEKQGKETRGRAERAVQRAMRDMVAACGLSPAGGDEALERLRARSIHRADCDGSWQDWQLPSLGQLLARALRRC